MTTHSQQHLKATSNSLGVTGAARCCEASTLPPERVTTAPTHLRHLRVSEGFSFIGTAADHLQRTDRAIREARKGHKPVRDLLRRKRLLKARCAALGAVDG